MATAGKPLTGEDAACIDLINNMASSSSLAPAGNLVTYTIDENLPLLSPERWADSESEQWPQEEEIDDESSGKIYSPPSSPKSAVKIS